MTSQPKSCRIQVGCVQYTVSPELKLAISELIEGSESEYFKKGPGAYVISKDTMRSIHRLVEEQQS